MMLNKILLLCNILYSGAFVMNKQGFSLDMKRNSKNKYLIDDFYDSQVKYDKKVLMKTLYYPRTPNQQKYNNDITNSSIKLLISSGPAGTGKTLFPTQYAAKLLLETDTRIILTRPLISVDEELGYLPGGINEKMHPWIIPIFDILGEFISPQKLETLIKEKRIEIVPLAFMRGRTFKNTLIIGDELQNSSINQMLMLLTRIGENSKLIITGDITQCDNTENGLLDLINRIELFYNKKDNKNYLDLLKKDNISMVNMMMEDVQRSELISTILNIYNN